LQYANSGWWFCPGSAPIAAHIDRRFYPPTHPQPPPDGRRPAACFADASAAAAAGYSLASTSCPLSCFCCAARRRPTHSATPCPARGDCPTRRARRSALASGRRVASCAERRMRASSSRREVSPCRRDGVPVRLRSWWRPHERDACPRWRETPARFGAGAVGAPAV
jgi:hypothetical protein